MSCPTLTADTPAVSLETDRPTDPDHDPRLPHFLRRGRYPLTLTSCANSFAPVRDCSVTMPIPGP